MLANWGEHSLLHLIRSLIMIKTHLGEFCKYTSLNVLGMIGLSCYILADTFFVANGTGSNGLAALNIAIPAFNPGVQYFKITL